MSMRAVDLFAGAGGLTTGAVAAGVRVLWAANHWRAAVDVHAANHPGIEHSCQDLHQADWSRVPRHDLLLAAPSCQGHSKSRGKERPHHDAARSTAWAVVSCVEVHRPAFGIVENVPEFRQWIVYDEWKATLAKLGYSVAEHVVDAADLGVPQNRVRLLLVLARSRAPLFLDLPRRPHVPIRDVLDWSDHAKWKPIHGRRRPLVQKTLARIEAGRAAHGDRFVVPYYGATRGGRGVDRPIGTLTTRDRYLVVDHDRSRMLSLDEARAAMGFPAGYKLGRTHAASMMMLGNAVVPVVATAMCEALACAA